MATRREMIESQRPGRQNIDTGTVIGPKTALEHRQNVIQNNQTVYQQNLANPINLPKQPDNTRSMISNIMQLGKRDAAKGAQALDLFGQLQMDSTSPFYAPYSKPTNQAVGQMSELLGQDVGEVNSDWLNRNSWTTRPAPQPTPPPLRARRLRRKSGPGTTTISSGRPRRPRRRLKPSGPRCSRS